MPFYQREDVLLPSPKAIRTALPMTAADSLLVRQWRETIVSILSKADPRLLVIIGPCAVQRVDATLDYARRLHDLASSMTDRFFFVMRTYVEKSRSSADWKGFLYSQQGAESLHNGIVETRSLFLTLVRAGVPIAMEFLEPLAAPYFSDLISWGCIGARTVQSTIHRELASQLPMPVGMKNTTDGSVDAAVHAIAAANKPHVSFGITDDGKICQRQTPGNPHAHLVLRGGIYGPNYREPQIQKASDLLRRLELSNAIVVDCSHGNSQRKWERQPAIFLDVLHGALKSPASSVRGLMIESFLLEGTQEKLLSQAKTKQATEDVRYGASLIDGCLGWKATAELVATAYEQCSTSKRAING